MGIPSFVSPAWLEEFIAAAFIEDLGGEADHTSMATVPETAVGEARALAKDHGILAGVELVRKIYAQKAPELEVKFLKRDGDKVAKGDIIFELSGSARQILITERIVLNCMQRMSGIATYTSSLKQLIAHTNAQLLDTRKTTPNLRPLEKWAVHIGGGSNHRMGLYDLIMVKDNHIDYAGSISAALKAAKTYRESKGLTIDIEIETRSLQEVKEALKEGGAEVIMLDNMKPEVIKEALQIINGVCKTEASGGINENTISAIAETGVDYISVGALTHSYKSLDISLKARKKA